MKSSVFAILLLGLFSAQGILAQVPNELLKDIEDLANIEKEAASLEHKLEAIAEKENMTTGDRFSYSGYLKRADELADKVLAIKERQKALFESNSCPLEREKIKLLEAAGLCVYALNKMDREVEGLLKKTELLAKEQATFKFKQRVQRDKSVFQIISDKLVKCFE